MQTCDVNDLCAATVKKQTRESHEAAEGIMMPLLERINDPESYALLLQKFYAYYSPLETILRPFAAAMEAPFLLEKSQLIKKDLQQLGQTPVASLCGALPRVANKFQALGALYVLEGAALGGRIIARMLGAKQVLPSEAFHFFEGRGKETGPHWTWFIHFLNNQAERPEQIEQVVAAAKETFETHAAWMKTP